MEKAKKINHLLIAFTILVQPLLDVLRKAGCANYEFLGLSILELSNIFLIGIIFILTIVTYKEKRKLLKWLALLIPYLIYFIFHYYNTTFFNNSVYPKQTVSFLTENYYILRLFIMPLVLLFSIYYSGIKKKDLLQILELFILITAGSICILNVFSLSFYAYDNGNLIDYTIFDWFNYDGDNYQKLSSKGLFLSGNQISAIMFMTLPIIMYLAYKKQSVYNYLILILQVIAMYMLGTKIANIGSVLIFIVFILVLLFNRFFLKNKIKNVTILILIFIIMLCLFPFSPRGYEMFSKDKTEESTVTSSTNFSLEEKDEISSLNCQNLSKKDKLELDIFIKKNSSTLKYSDYFLKNYPVSYNYKYWCYMVKERVKNLNKTIDYRVMKTSILNQIYIYNENKLDKWFGMGQTLNYIYTEEDYTYQFYIYGIFGIILFFGPYLLILFYGIFILLKEMIKNKKITNIFYVMALMIAMIIPYLSGHVFERNFPLYILAFIASINLLALKKE